MAGCVYILSNELNIPAQDLDKSCVSVVNVFKLSYTVNQLMDKVAFNISLDFVNRRSIHPISTLVALYDFFRHPIYPLLPSGFFDFHFTGLHAFLR